MFEIAELGLAVKKSIYKAMSQLSEKKYNLIF